MKNPSRKPDFIGLGAQKAGTSWIHACLYQHPQISMPTKKELHFFSRHYAKGFEWYENHFSQHASGAIAGEFSPTYLYDEATPERLYTYHPQVKLIVCLREPVARTVSAYRYALQTGRLPADLTFDEVVDQYPAYVQHSCYYRQLERYLTFFDRQQILITLYEDIGKTPLHFMQQVYQFLGVAPSFRPSMVGTRVNASRAQPRSQVLDQLIKGVARNGRRLGLGHLVWAIGRSKAMQKLLQLNTLSSLHQPLSEPRRAALQRLFAPDVRALAALLQRDLRSVWFDYDNIMVS